MATGKPKRKEAEKREKMVKWRKTMMPATIEYEDSAVYGKQRRAASRRLPNQIEGEKIKEKDMKEIELERNEKLDESMNSR